MRYFQIVSFICLFVLFGISMAKFSRHHDQQHDRQVGQIDGGRRRSKELPILRHSGGFSREYLEKTIREHKNAPEGHDESNHAAAILGFRRFSNFNNNNNNNNNKENN